MSSQVPRVNVITRQRLLSDDFNNAGRLNAKGMLLAELARSLDTEFLSGAAGRGGVIGGFMVRAITGSNRIEVSPGIGLVAATPVSATYDPPVVWVQLEAAVEVDLDSLVDGGNPRLVTIELEPVDATLVSSPVDVFEPATGTFGVDLAAARVVGSDPNVLATAGAASANPVVAAGTIGRLPIAIVKLTAGQANFTDDFAPVLMCRPLLEAPGSKLAPRSYVYGGGVSVGEESGGAIINLTSLYLSKCSAQLRGIEADVSGLIEFATVGRTPDTTDTATLLASAQPVYGYAAAPPWAEDYGDIAPREAWQRNPNAIPSSTIGNIVGGSGNTFSSLIAETTSSSGKTLRNAIIIWDNTAPFGTERGAGNAPLQVLDARGPHPDTAPGGAGSITLDATQDPTWGATQDVVDTVYIGAVSSLGIAANFMAQAESGAGRIRITDEHQIIGATQRRPSLGAAATVGLTSFYPGKYPDMLVGDDSIIPDVQRLEVWVRHITGTGGAAEGYVLPEFGFGSIEDTLTLGGWGVAFIAAFSLTTITPSVPLELSATAGALYALTDPGGASIFIVLAAYTDPILAARC